jgi:hypothetical protein
MARQREWREYWYQTQQCIWTRAVSYSVYLLATTPVCSAMATTSLLSVPSLPQFLDELRLLLSEVALLFLASSVAQELTLCHYQ